MTHCHISECIMKLMGRYPLNVTDVGVLVWSFLFNSSASADCNKQVSRAFVHNYPSLPVIRVTTLGARPHH